MKLTTRAIRNITFATMLAVIPLMKQVPVFAGETCGPYFCSSLCALSGNGGWIAWRDCDPDSCSGSGCAGGGENCYDFCIWCEEDEGEEFWLCEEP